MCGWLRWDHGWTDSGCHRHLKLDIYMLMSDLTPEWNCKVHLNNHVHCTCMHCHSCTTMCRAGVDWIARTQRTCNDPDQSSNLDRWKHNSIILYCKGGWEVRQWRMATKKTEIDTTPCDQDPHTLAPRLPTVWENVFRLIHSSAGGKQHFSTWGWCLQN